MRVLSRHGHESDDGIRHLSGDLATAEGIDSPVDGVGSIVHLAGSAKGDERKDPVQGAVLRAWMDGQILPRFSGRILPVDIAVAQRCAKLHVPDPRPERDSFIAATALVHGMTVVTRNAEDFMPMGVEISNPWEWDAADPEG